MQEERGPAWACIKTYRRRLLRPCKAQANERLPPADTVARLEHHPLVRILLRGRHVAAVTTMSASSTTTGVPQQVTYNKARLFSAGALALAMTGINASLRANTASDLQRIFLDPIDKVRSAEMIGSILGLPFLGYAVTIAIGSPLLDYIGMGLLLPLSGVLMSIGMLIMIFAGSLASGAGVYGVLWTGALVTGLGWGMVETVTNPVSYTHLR